MTTVVPVLSVLISAYNEKANLMYCDAQHSEDSPFFATAKYMLALPDQPRPDNAELLKDFDGVGLWYLPDALPFAFSADPALLQPYARLDGPNRVVVTGQPAHPNDRLVVLVSNYLGWRLLVDGQSATLTPINDYLGAVMLPGEHTYIFIFSPLKHYIGLTISPLALALTLGLIMTDISGRPTSAQ